jgi:hypothetical protein
LKDIDTFAMKKRYEYYNSDDYLKKRQQNGYKLQDFPIFPRYFDDKYWLIGDNYLINKVKTDTIHVELMKIVSYNGIPFEKYIEDNCKRDFRYDYQRLKYYYGKWGFKIPATGVLKGIQNNKTIEFNVENYQERILDDHYQNSIVDIWLSGISKQEEPYFIKNKRVDFFEQDSILFIYIDKMNEDTAFCNKIKEIGKDKKINKVVIDVRGNLGGSDAAWHNVLTAIIKDSLPYHVRLASNNTKMMKKKFNGYKYQPNTCGKIEWLNNKKVMLIDENDYLKSDTNSLNYDGKIYILKDRNTYSAAHSLVNYADQIDKFISIGCPTGQLQGFGIAPFLFQLKYSKFTFRMPCTIDILNCNKAIDVYKDFPKVLVYPTFEEEMLFPRTRYDIKSKEYLGRFDSMFMNVLKLE